MRERMHRNAMAASAKNYLSGRTETARSAHLLRDVGTYEHAKVDSTRKHAEPSYYVTAHLAWSVEAAL